MKLKFPSVRPWLRLFLASACLMLVACGARVDLMGSVPEEEANEVLAALLKADIAVLETDERVVADLRRQLYGHLLRLDAEFHDRTRSGELVSRLSADSELLRSVVGSSMSVALRSTITVIGSIVMLFVTSPKLAAYALVGIPLAVAPILLGARKLEKASRASQDRV